MLVTTGCLRGAVVCAARPLGSGAVVVMQPCTRDRVPDGASYWIGPITDNPDDLRTICAWLEAGEWDPDVLPARLLCATKQRVRIDSRQN